VFAPHRAYNLHLLVHVDDLRRLEAVEVGVLRSVRKRDLAPTA
jgi:hypothetical protein